MLYFYRFIIIFNVTLQQVLLVIELNLVRHFVSKCPVSQFFILKYTAKVRYEERESDHVIFHAGRFYELKA